MNLTDNQLAKKCQKGNPTAQRALYEKYKVPMFRLCLRYARDRPGAEDILQEGFIKVFKDIKGYKGTGALGGWIRKVMVNTALAQIRKDAKLFVVENLDSATDVPGLEDIYSMLEAKALTKLIQKLPDGYRIVFNMYVVEGYAHKEIADQLQITTSTSKSQLSKAKAHLRKMVLAQMEIKRTVG